MYSSKSMSERTLSIFVKLGESRKNFTVVIFGPLFYYMAFDLFIYLFVVGVLFQYLI